MQWTFVSTAFYAITQIWPHVQHQLQACIIPLQAQRQMSPSQLETKMGGLTMHHLAVLWPDSQGDVVAET